MLIRVELVCSYLPQNLVLWLISRESDTEKHVWWSHATLTMLFGGLIVCFIVTHLVISVVWIWMNSHRPHIGNRTPLSEWKGVDGGEHAAHLLSESFTADAGISPNTAGTNATVTSLHVEEPQVRFTVKWGSTNKGEIKAPASKLKLRQRASSRSYEQTTNRLFQLSFIKVAE